MQNVVFRPPAADELPLVSAQIAQSYKAAYKTMMRASYLDSLPEDHWLPILQAGLAGGDTCLIAEANGQIIGTAVYGKSKSEPKCADWHAIYLSPSHIGQGLGHLFYVEIEKTMRAQGYKSCTLEVLVQNRRAIEFYLRHGYALTSTFTVHENGMQLECHTMKKQWL